LPQSVDDYSVILALKRPGPMDYRDEVTGRTMDEEYVWRRQGKSKCDFKELYDLIPETYGIIVFQEQSLKISKELGGMTPSDAEKLRRLFSKKLKKEAGEMKPVFMSTAISKIGEEKANKIWDMMETSSRYSFNCIDGDQEVLTEQGMVKIGHIANNPCLYRVAYADLQNGNLMYETPNFGCSKGTKEVWTLELSNGKILSATPDHKFLSEGKWITLKDIVEKGLQFDERKET
jgi:hypothetical protein